MLQNRNDDMFDLLLSLAPNLNAVRAPRLLVGVRHLHPE